MKIKQNLLAACLFPVMLLPAAAQSPYLQYATTNGQITITNCTAPEQEIVVVPDTINGLPVVAIGPYAFSYEYYGASSGSLSGIIMNGTNLTTLGDHACADQYYATIVLPPNLTSIGDDAFLNCFQYQTNLTLPGTVQSIGIEAFKYVMFTSVVIPRSVTNLSAGAFDYIEQLKAIYFQGGPPANMGSDIFILATNATIYVPTGTTGWPPITSDTDSPFGYGPQAIAPYSIVINGGFDDTGGFDGWTVTGSGSAQVTGPNVYNGPYAAVFNETAFTLDNGIVGGTSNYLSQTLATQPGQSYMLSFDVNGVAGGYCSVSWAGQALSVPRPFNPGWTNVQFVVTASSSNTVLQFYIGPVYEEAQTVIIDSVSLVPLPQITTQPTNGNQLELSGFTGRIGASYALDRASSLKPPVSWVPRLTNVSDTNGNVAFTDTPVAHTNNFWRFRSVP